MTGECPECGGSLSIQAGQAAYGCDDCGETVPVVDELETLADSDHPLAPLARAELQRAKEA